MKRALAPFALLATLAAPAWPAAPVARLGEELRVNTTTRGAQISPAVAGNPQGDFVAVWSGPDPETGAIQVLGQRFDALGAKRGGEIRISSGGGIFGWPPRVAVGPDGDFVTVWTGPGIRARFYDRNGAPKGDPVGVDAASPMAFDGDAALDAGGEAMIVWTTGTSTGRGILARRFDAQGQPLGEPLPLSQGQDLPYSQSRVAAAPGGGFLAVWSEQRLEPGESLWGRRFDPVTRTWGAAFQLSAPDNTTHLDLSLAFRPDGSFLLVWTSAPTFSYFPTIYTPEVLGQSFRADGTPEGGAVALGLAENFSPAAVAVDRDGNALVLADNEGSLDSPRGVRAVLYDRAWKPLTPPMLVHDDHPATDAAPGVAASAGGFLAVWSRDVADSTVPAPAWTDGSSWGIFGQRLGDPRCAAGSAALCLGPGGQFEIRVDWRNPNTGETGTGKALPLTGDTGALWFFGSDNLELMVKVLDGRGVNGRFWLFYGALSDVEYTVTATNTATGEVQTYRNPAGQSASRADVQAFTDPAAPTLPAQPAAAAAAESLALNQERFQVKVDFVDPRDGAAGKARAVPVTADTGAFWFFDPRNLELTVKVLDGRGVNGHFWVFYGALSDVQYTLTVTDTMTGKTRTYHNDRRHLASGSDIQAF
jgi:hypothetical protein